MTSVRLLAITKEYGERRVLEGINADIASGSSLVVTGRNGSGKSTLLRVIAGLTRPTSGQVAIEIDGKVLAGEERRNAIGFVAPDLALYEELTALENLAFFAKARGMRRSRKDLRELIARVDLAGREDEPLSSYSSGMKQRMKYAFALLHEAPVLLLDEPTANLDENGVALVDEIIREHRKEGLLILATNDKREVGYGDQIIQLGF
ncbi:MAG: heme ABC exporter ATP-binding protein CcmA [Armatimonadota bacterium]|nr:heme ABC exporter ATP-binding protein CcmA [Armatimonadota bacterium]